MYAFYDFLNVYFDGIATIFVGLFAFIIYSKQKFDHKRETARVILLEITNAERLVIKAKELIGRDPKELLKDEFLMPSENWNKYKYLFVNDFKRNEWDALSDFYGKAIHYDQAVVYNNSFFQKNEEAIRQNLQKSFADLISNKLDKNFKYNSNSPYAFPDEIGEKFDKFYDLYISRGQLTKVFYSPQKPINDAQLILQSMNNNISTSSIGTKLEELSNKKFLFIF